MFLKFLSKYYPHSREVQLRKNILNFQQLPLESVFEAWKRFKSCLRKYHDHIILLLNQIMTFYHGITMIDQDRIMVAAGGNIMRKTPQEAYDLIENMTQHHFQWDAEVYYDTTPDMSAHYSDTTYTSIAPFEVLGKQTAYTIQSVRHQPRPGHPNTIYYLDSDENDEDEPSEVLEVQRSIHHLSGSPTPSSDPIVESLFLLPSRISSGSTTTHSDYSLSDYEAFYFDDDLIEEKSSGSTTTHSDFSLPEYDSFIFDLSIDPLPSADRSDLHHEEFVDELAHIIPPPKYDYFYFDLDTDPGEFSSVVEKNIFDLSSTKDSTSIELNDTLLLSDCDSSLSKEFSEIDLLVSFPFGNEHIIFDLGIFIIKGVQSERFHILPLDDFYSISFVSAPLFLTDPLEIETFLSFLAENEDKVFDPGIFFINGVFSFVRKTPHLLNDNFLIDKCHSFSGISLMTESSVSYCTKDKGIWALLWGRASFYGVWYRFCRIPSDREDMCLFSILQSSGL
nr:hypothetical protein [Tanacetum cinerariifolium]